VFVTFILQTLSVNLLNIYILQYISVHVLETFNVTLIKATFNYQINEG